MGIELRIQVVFSAFFFSCFIMNSKLDLFLWELVLRYANISNQTSPIFQCEWARFQAKMLSQQNPGKIYHFPRFQYATIHLILSASNCWNKATTQESS